MKEDILTVMWKEWKAMFRVKGRRSQTLLTMISPLLLSIWLPWEMGLDWLERSMSLMLALVVAFILVGITIPDSFAGERERHTLPTLLASRLPDRAILIGKIATSVLFAWGVTLVMLLISLITVNVTNWQGRILFFNPSVLLADLAVGGLVAVLTAGLGVVFSLRSSTVQQAQQATMSVMLIPAMVLQFAALLVLRSDAAKETLRRTVGSLSFTQLMLVIVAVLGAIAALLLITVVARFKRARLILSQ